MRRADLAVLLGLALVYREVRATRKAAESAALAAIAAGDDPGITDLKFWRQALRNRLAAKVLGG